MQVWGLPHSGHDIDKEEGKRKEDLQPQWRCSVVKKKKREEKNLKQRTPPSHADFPLPPLTLQFFENGVKTITSASAEEAGDRRRAKRIRGWGGGQNVKAGSFSTCCVTINSDTLNNSVSDIESAVCQQPCLWHSQKAAAPLVAGHTIKRTIRETWWN